MLLTSLAICKNPLTICFANGNLSPLHNNPSVYNALSLSFDGSFALPTILNSLLATRNLVTTSSGSSVSIFVVNGVSDWARASCFGVELDRGRPEQRARSETAEHDVLTSSV